MYYSDRPITRPGQDALGRAKFAERLAFAIDQLPRNGVAKDGYVLALNGAWGFGKTSTVELVIRYLRHIEMLRASERPIVPDRDAAPRSLA
jgi:predicted KAP-like P-loop ATPase